MAVEAAGLRLSILLAAFAPSIPICPVVLSSPVSAVSSSLMLVTMLVGVSIIRFRLLQLGKDVIERPKNIGGGSREALTCCAGPPPSAPDPPTHPHGW